MQLRNTPAQPASKSPLIPPESHKAGYNHPKSSAPTPSWWTNPLSTLQERGVGGAPLWWNLAKILLKYSYSPRLESLRTWRFRIGADGVAARLTHKMMIYILWCRCLFVTKNQSPVTIWTTHNHPVQLQVIFDGSRLVFHGSLLVFIGF